ncbi:MULTISPECIES: hypothetical protein [Bacteria]|uniref:hypothetical protein n=1 Tax=Bacteria TaxID=2 RepID=UPI000D993EBD|nr:MULTISPECIES: hypothetical protein [Bacteria]MDU1400284.1 hypothetical protein [Finegoldia magna]MDU7723780.1 hypothetical protein [Citrobacter sp.]SQA84045.1 Uncharacterised protein [Citrobacter freundii]
MKISYFFIAFIITAIIFIASTYGAWMLNTFDWWRAIDPIIDTNNGVVTAFNYNQSFIIPLRDDFKDISSLTYMSSFSIIIYLMALITSFFSNTINIAIVGSLFKLVLFFGTLLVCKEISKNNLYIFIVNSFISSIIVYDISSLSIFNGFYQETIAICSIPYIIYMLQKKGIDKTSFITGIVAILLFSTSKSQFFYLPLLLAPMVVFFENRRVMFIVSMLIILIISIACIFSSTDATNANKYNASYYGVLLAEKNMSIKTPSWADDECIGIDMAGNKYDINTGAIDTGSGGDCYFKNLNIGFSNAIIEYIKHPSIILFLPLDAGVQQFLTTDYFHVFKSIKLVNGTEDNKLLNFFSSSKDKLFREIKIPLSLIIMVFAILTIKRCRYVEILFISMIIISQFYVSFIGEGYRDLAKHLAVMNFCFDFMIFLIVAKLISFFAKK